MNANLVSILTWANPVKSAGYLIVLNVILRILYYQRPIGAIAIASLVYFIRHLWKHRIRPEVLVDPPDSEDWVNLGTYDLEKSAVDFGKSIFTCWIALRSDHYLMWVILTSVFWITLAKVSCLVSFPTILFVVSNGVFVAFPVLKNLKYDVLASSPVEFDMDDPIGITNLPERNENPYPKTLQFLQDLSANISSALGRNGTDGISVEETVLTRTSITELRERSQTPPEPESLTPFGAVIPSHEDSSEDEFLFDAAHIESSSSSTSNSFELLQF